MPSYYYKEKTPESLNETLLTSPYFKSNWKLVPAVVRLLNRINGYNEKDKGASSISWTTFHNQFGQKYFEVRRELEKLQLLENDGICRQRYTYGIKDHGKCYSYTVTSFAQEMLADENKQYLYKLLTDPTEKRKNQKRISKRKHTHKQYGDVRDHLKELNDEIGFSWEEITPVVDRYPAGKKAYIYSLLTDIVKKDYSSLEHNSKDNRVWTPYAQLPAEIKALIKVQGLSYIATIDIRSCYPSLWAEYLHSIFPSESSEQERATYNSIFLNKERDPKDYLSNLLGIERDKIKEVLIQYFNGKRVPKDSNNPFRKFQTWLQSEFPTLFKLWKTTDIKQTGNNIGKHFETRLMLDESIYNKAKALGIVIGYEYDGMSFYGHAGNDIQPLLSFIKSRSIELLGIELVFTRKDNRWDLQEFKTKPEMELLYSYVEANEKKLSHIRGRCWASNNWTHYRKIENENIQLLQKIVRLSELGNTNHSTDKLYANN